MQPPVSPNLTLTDSIKASSDKPTSWRNFELPMGFGARRACAA
jgi:hypothetical protein